MELLVGGWGGERLIGLDEDPIGRERRKRSVNGGLAAELPRRCLLGTSLHVVSRCLLLRPRRALDPTLRRRAAHLHIRRPRLAAHETRTRRWYRCAPHSLLLSAPPFLSGLRFLSSPSFLSLSHITLGFKAQTIMGYLHDSHIAHEQLHESHMRFFYLQYTHFCRKLDYNTPDFIFSLSSLIPLPLLLRSFTASISMAYLR